jgi:type II secretory pathway pseudopilin PulG
MLELLVVIAIVMVIAGMALLQLQPSLQLNRANAGMTQVRNALRQGREAAVSDRRTVQVQFFTGAPCQAGMACIVLTRLDPPANVPTVILKLPVESSVQFIQFAGEPDTPDGFGKTAPIVFGGVAGGPPTMEFQSDGSFTDGNGNVINGTLFMGVANFPSSAMAITILGGTGRVHSYRCPSGTWVY